MAAAQVQQCSWCMLIAVQPEVAWRELRNVYEFDIVGYRDEPEVDTRRVASQRKERPSRLVSGKLREKFLDIQENSGSGCEGPSFSSLSVVLRSFFPGGEIDTHHRAEII